MSDNVLSAVLTFSLLAGGAAAIGSELLQNRQPARAEAPIVVMPQVTITAQRAAPVEIVTMPQVTITARRLAPVEVVTMPQVTVTAQQATPAEIVTMPMVVVTGRREAVTVAAETRASETPRVQ